MTAASAVTLEVAASEDGMKLLRFLERRLAERVPNAALHKWIRSGQVRVNGGRSKPFSRLAVGDLVRLPPFALTRNLDAQSGAQVGDPTAESPGREGAFPYSSASPVPARPPDPLTDLGPDIRIVGRTPRLLVLAKPAGLPCQPGSGHADSLSARLAAAFAGAPFIPAPAHRIDRHTSGLVAVGLSHSEQRRLHALFASGGVRKEYLAWVWGDWTLPGPCLLEDRLVKQSAAGRESMTALPGGRLVPLPEKRGGVDDASPSASSAACDADPGFAASAALAVQRLSINETPRSLCHAPGLRRPARTSLPHGATDAPDASSCATLLLLRLFTGRTHQLRAQLASRGFPIIGDGRYGAPPFPHMLLHAFALSLPDDGPADPVLPRAAEAPATDGWLEFRLPPAWPAPFAPDPSLLAPARQRLARAVERSRFACPA